MSSLPATRPPVKPARKPRQRRPHERSVKVLITPTPGQPLLLVRITQDGEQAHYWVSPLVSDFGRAYRFEKPGFEGEEEYHVLLEEDGTSCTCAGHTYGGYCKHVDACSALLNAGKLPLPPVTLACPDPDDLGEACGQCFPDDLPF